MRGVIAMERGCAPPIMGASQRWIGRRPSASGPSIDTCITSSRVPTSPPRRRPQVAPSATMKKIDLRKPTAGKGRKRKPGPAGQVVAERSNTAAVSRALWKGLSTFNREQAGPFRFSRIVLSARDRKGKLLGGLILRSYWLESYIELLWLSEPARGAGFGGRLIREAERRAQLRGSRVIYLNTYSFQAPGFYEKQGYRRFGTKTGSPRGASHYYYLKRLRAI